MKKKTLFLLILVIVIASILGFILINQKVINIDKIGFIEEINKPQIQAIADSGAQVVQTWDISKTENDNVSAVLYSDGLLVISGTGKMENNVYESPFKSNKDDIVNVEIQQGVTNIGSYAFYSCTSLTSITIPESVTSIGDSVFEYCRSLTSINIPEGVTSIGSRIFYNCTSLISITIPEGVTSIAYSAFYNCTSLTSITIPEGVTSIGNEAIYGCTSLTSINVSEGNEKYYSENGVLFDKEKTKLICYPSKKSESNYSIPLSVTSIEDYAFYYCESLTSIKIPEGVTSIGESAFCNCTSLTSISIPKGVTSIGERAFYKCTSLTSIKIPEGVTSIGERAFYDCESLTSIKIPEGVTSIGKTAFYGCRSLTSIKIPEGVTSIGERTFYDCKSLTSITIPEGVTRIGEDTFWCCISLTSITIPESVTSIGDSVFEYCRSLTSINIPEGVTSIGNSAFRGCTSLTMYCKSNTVAEQYAKDNKISYIIDDTAPVIGSVTGNPTEWTKENVTLVINAKDNLSGLAKEAYSFDGGVTWQESNKKTYTENTKGIVIKVRDNVGNIIIYEEIDVKIDRQEPRIYDVEGSNWTSGNVTINAKDELSGLANEAYSFDGGVTWQESNTKTYTQDTNGIIIKVKDNVGNITTYKEINIKIDTKEPEIISVTGNPTEWTKENVALTVNAKDELSGLAQEAYSFDGGNTWFSENTISVINNIDEIEIKVRDQAGNVTTYAEKINITKIDKQEPIIILKEKLSDIVYTKQNVTLHIVDSESGLNQGINIKYGWSESNTIEPSYTTVKLSLSHGDKEVTYQISTNNLIGKQYLWIKADPLSDIVGNNNLSQYVFEVNVDNTEPIIESVTGNPIEWTKEDVTLTVTAKDELSGLAQEAYSFDGGVTWQESNTKTYTENTNGIVIKVKDNLGNIATYEEINITKIDKQLPVIESITGNPTEWTKEDVTLTINAKDELSGLAQEAYSFDGGVTWQESNTKTYTENTNGIVIKVKDNLGNIETYEEINITKIIKIESISIKTLPSKTTYYKGNNLDTKGLILNVKYDNNTTEEITSGFTYTPTELNTIGTQEITVTYEGKTTTFEVQVIKASVSSDEYYVEDNYVKEIQEETTVEKLLQNITTEVTDIKIIDKDGNDQKESDIVKTGMKIIVNEENTYTLVVKGDTNGDGKADLKDILSINKHRLNKLKLVDEYELAGDINKDAKVDLRDLLQINKYRLGKTNEL